MAKEEEIQKELIKNFNYLEGKIKVQRVRRIFADIPAEKLEEVLKYLKEKAGFIILCTITGLDEGGTLGFIYHFAREDGIILNLKISVSKERPKIKTIMNYFPNSVIYEREVIDLLGAEVEGLPEGMRYPLPDGWPAGQHPLRKDWKVEMLNK